jgi:hypothetical protein
MKLNNDLKFFIKATYTILKTHRNSLIIKYGKIDSKEDKIYISNHTFCFINYFVPEYKVKIHSSEHGYHIYSIIYKFNNLAKDINDYYRF